MRRVEQAYRLLQVQRALIRHRLDEQILTSPWLVRFRFLYALLPWNWLRTPDTLGRGERIRRLLAELGPIYVKFGQMASTRGDMLPDDITRELSQLRDRVPPFPSAEVRAILQREYDRPVEEVFAEFSDTPIASASIAQVHPARLQDGQQIIVKVVRPGIRGQIDHDLDFIRVLAGMADKYWPAARRLHLAGVVEEFHKTLTRELDMQREAANISQMRRNFAGSPDLHVPRVHWQLTTSRVLVTERISGVSVHDHEQLRAEGYDLREVAEKGIEVFFTQVFRDKFFHADMHPGNIFITRNERGGVCFLLVDFGIVSSLSEYDQRYLSGNFMAMLKRDYQQVARLHVESGWVPRDTRIDEFESAVRAVCEPLFDRPLKEVSFGTLLLHLFRTAQQFHMEIMPQLLLLQKTLINVEGLGRQLCPDLNPWDTARPLMEEWMRERHGMRRLLTSLKTDMPAWLENLPALPERAIGALERLEQRPAPPPAPAPPARSLQAGIGGALLGAAATLSLTAHHLPAATIPLLILTGATLLLLRR